MDYRNLGNTGLRISEIGFGCWAIGGNAKVGKIPISWGESKDEESTDALKIAFENGINFFDTADFYGLGHSEELLGQVFYKNNNVIIATKAGHKISKDNSIELDYTKDYLISACENSLKRLKRDHVDIFQLHSAKLLHLEQGECIEAVEKLKKDGKIQHWGISLNTFNPYPEAEYIIKNQLNCSSFQLVYNIINSSSFNLIDQAYSNGIGLIARMPLQFGLLTGKFKKGFVFQHSDHRSFRINDEIIEEFNVKIFNIIKECNLPESINLTSLALGFVLSQKKIATTIPGIRNVGQVLSNIDYQTFSDEMYHKIRKSSENHFSKLLKLIKQTG